MFDLFLGDLLLTRNVLEAKRCTQNYICWRQEGLGGEDPFKKGLSVIIYSIVCRSVVLTPQTVNILMVLYSTVLGIFSTNSDPLLTF